MKRWELHLHKSQVDIIIQKMKIARFYVKKILDFLGKHFVRSFFCAFFAILILWKERIISTQVLMA